MRKKKVIVAVAIVVLAGVGYVGYLLSRDPRDYQLSEGEVAVIALSPSDKNDQMLLGDASSEDVVPLLKDGDQIKVVKDPVGDRLRSMRKVSVLVESGKCKGLSGTVARLWIRPTSLLRGRGDF